MITRPPVSGNTCNLECLKKNPLKTFEGPVKVVLLDIPRRDYCERMWYAAFIGLAYIMLGFPTITMLIFSSSWIVKDFESNLHILLCTLGFQLLMPAGILMVTNLNGPSAPLKPLARRLNHIVAQLFALAMVTVGIVLLLISRLDQWPTILTKTGHCLFGIAAFGLMIIAAILGPIGFGKDRMACYRGGKALHSWIGLFAYACSTIAFIWAIFTEKFFNWISALSDDAPYLMAIFCGSAAFIIIAFTTYKICCFARYCEPKI